MPSQVLQWDGRFTDESCFAQSQRLTFTDCLPKGATCPMKRSTTLQDSILLQYQRVIIEFLCTKAHRLMSLFSIEFGVEKL